MKEFDKVVSILKEKAEEHGLELSAEISESGVVKFYPRKAKEARK